MGSVRLRAGDGHDLDAYVAEPQQRAARGVVIVQEIFGVNGHIRGVAEDYARAGYLAVAPALFDRMQRDVELDYSPESQRQGMAMIGKIGIENALLDVAAALDFLKGKVGGEHAGVVGYCLGGSLAWLAATRLHPAAAVGYYGGRIAQYAAEQPRCPVMLHFGTKDANIPRAEIDKIREHHPELPIFLYQAGHGFNCDQRKDYDAAAAKLARERTLEFLGKHL